ncbi:MAG: lysozyme inhibitor LprI family protein [Burkholderiaceae bacterium]
MAELPFRLMTLEQAFKSHDRAEKELSRYFPVALVACMEGYFRMAVRDLVDAGDPYLANAEKVVATVKLDFSLMRAVHGRHVTIGEIIGHSVPISRFEHIEATFSSLLGTSFRAKLQSTTDRLAHEVRGEPSKPILDKPDEIFTNVKRTFELRHVICHELVSAYEINTLEIEHCFESCVAFLRAADECISETLNPGVPLTQTDMNIAAHSSQQDAEARLAAVVATIEGSATVEEVAALNQVQANWLVFCESWIALRVGDRSQGGSMWPMLYSGLKQSEIERRIDDLQKYRDHVEYEI